MYKRILCVMIAFCMILSIVPVRAEASMPTKDRALGIAEKYYKMAFPQIEQDLKQEYNRLVTWKPDFSGKMTDAKRASLHSVNVAVSISYTDARNFYLSMAAAVFDLDPQSRVGSSNLAAAIATYYDDALAEKNGHPNAKEFYSDAVEVYKYALGVAAPDGKYNKNCLSILSSLGNLYIDINEFDKANACFEAALKVDESYIPARQGRYNYYFAVKKYDQALEMLGDEKFYPCFAKTIADNNKKQPEVMKKEPPGEEQPEVVFESTMDKLKDVDFATAGDFFSRIDPGASAKIRKLVQDVQSKIVYHAPDIVLVSQYTSLQKLSSPMGQSAVEAFEAGLEQYGVHAGGQYADNQLDKYKELGINIDLGGVSIEDLLKNPGKYENLNIQVSGEEDFEKNMQEMMNNLQNSTADPQQNWQEGFKAAAEGCPELAVLAMNPYKYANSIDLLVQRSNALAFRRKFTVYQNYLRKVNLRVQKYIQEQSMLLQSKQAPINETIDARVAEIEEKNLDEGKRIIEIHKVHEQYIPLLNKTADMVWKNVTNEAYCAYKQKIKKYGEQMYKDCMKHVLLISDEKVQQKLEKELKASIEAYITMGLNNVHAAATLVKYSDLHDCECNLEAVKAAVEKEKKEKARLAAVQQSKNLNAKKAFERMEIDENSQLYKKYIKPYEVKLTSPFVEGTVGPYKSNVRLTLNLPGVSLELGKLENHYRNTTTYDGGLELSGSTGAAQVKAFAKAAAVKGEKGRFAVEDIDIRGGGEVSTSVPGLDAKAGVEAVAARGTRSYAQVTLTGDKVLDELKLNELGNWAPELEKELWKGEYIINDGKGSE